MRARACVCVCVRARASVYAAGWRAGARGCVCGQPFYSFLFLFLGGGGGDGREGSFSFVEGGVPFLCLCLFLGGRGVLDIEKSVVKSLHQLLVFQQQHTKMSMATTGRERHQQQ